MQGAKIVRSRSSGECKIWVSSFSRLLWGMWVNTSPKLEGKFEGETKSRCLNGKLEKDQGVFRGSRLGKKKERNER